MREGVHVHLKGALSLQPSETSLFVHCFFLCPQDFVPALTRLTLSGPHW